MKLAIKALNNAGKVINGSRVLRISITYKDDANDLENEFKIPKINSLESAPKPAGSFHSTSAYFFLISYSINSHVISAKFLKRDGRLCEN